MDFSWVTEGGLVTDSRRDTTEKSGHFGTCLSEAENVVDEEQHVLALCIQRVRQGEREGEGQGERGSSKIKCLGSNFNLLTDENDQVMYRKREI